MEDFGRPVIREEYLVVRTPPIEAKRAKNDEYETHIALSPSFQA